MSTSTQNVKPDPGVLGGPHERRDRWSGGKKIGALAAAAVALVLIAAVLIIQSRDKAPATAQTPVAAETPENTVNARAMEVATGFVEAYGAFDVERAMTYLADDATIAVLGARDDPRLLMSWLEATGYQQIVDSCKELGNSASGSISCTFAFHALRSGELGRGPFGLTPVRAGRDRPIGRSTRPCIAPAGRIRIPRSAGRQRFRFRTEGRCLVRLRREPVPPIVQAHDAARRGRRAA
jgi:hypothetical protein